jgi:hypothetical protein
MAHQVGLIGVAAVLGGILAFIAVARASGLAERFWSYWAHREDRRADRAEAFDLLDPVVRESRFEELKKTCFYYDGQIMDQLRQEAKDLQESISAIRETLEDDEPDGDGRLGVINAVNDHADFLEVFRDDLEDFKRRVEGGEDVAQIGIRDLCEFYDELHEDVVKILSRQDRLEQVIAALGDRATRIERKADEALDEINHEGEFAVGGYGIKECLDSLRGGNDSDEYGVEDALEDAKDFDERIEKLEERLAEQEKLNAVARDVIMKPAQQGAPIYVPCCRPHVDDNRVGIVPTPPNSWELIPGQWWTGAVVSSPDLNEAGNA